ncbi:hypothetical protein F8B43_5189 [Methylorubrum populi]|uniref:Right handed beta helix domain-containing protein n=2 Tax=Methylorubrum populi TaxID=223967 RepID=A0A833J1H3_9HYPH|nr:hypothetical protein F8B43_5189 [Methylorubrum populi]
MVAASIASIHSENDGRNSSITGNMIQGFSTGGDGIIFQKAAGGVQPEGVRIQNNLTLTPGGKALGLYAGLAMYVAQNIFDQCKYGSIIDGTVNAIADVGYLNNWFGPANTWDGTEILQITGSAVDIRLISNAFVTFRTGLWLNGPGVQTVMVVANRFRCGSTTATAQNAGLRLTGAKNIIVQSNLFRHVTGNLAVDVIEDDNTSSALIHGNLFSINPTQRSSASVYERNWGDDLSTSSGDLGRRILLQAGAVDNLPLRFSAGNGWFRPETDAQAFATGGASRVYIAPNGAFGLGAFSPTDRPATASHIRASAAVQTVERTSADGSAPRADFRKSRDGAAVLAGDGLGGIRASGYDGSVWSMGGELTFEAAAAPSGGFIPGRARLRLTRADGTIADVFTANSSIVIWTVPHAKAGGTFAGLPTTGNTNGQEYRVTDRFNRTAKWYSADSTWRWEDGSIAS